MGGIGFSEILFICVIGLIFIGPEKLPKYAKIAGKTWTDLRTGFNAFKEEVEKEVSEPISQSKKTLQKVFEDDAKETKNLYDELTEEVKDTGIDPTINGQNKKK